MDLQTAEALGIRITLLPAYFLEALSNERFPVPLMADLALMAGKRPDLQIHFIRDIDPHVRRSGPEEIDLRGLVRGQPLLHKFGEEIFVPCFGVYGAKCGST